MGDVREELVQVLPQDNFQSIGAQRRLWQQQLLLMLKLIATAVFLLLTAGRMLSRKAQDEVQQAEPALVSKFALVQLGIQNPNIAEDSEGAGQVVLHLCFWRHGEQSVGLLVQPQRPRKEDPSLCFVVPGHQGLRLEMMSKRRIVDCDGAEALESR